MISVSFVPMWIGLADQTELLRGVISSTHMTIHVYLCIRPPVFCSLQNCRKTGLIIAAQLFRVPWTYDPVSIYNDTLGTSVQISAQMRHVTKYA